MRGHYIYICPAPYSPRKPVDTMTSEEVARRREQDLNRDAQQFESATAERRARYAREAYEEAGHHANYGAAAH